MRFANYKIRLANKVLAAVKKLVAPVPHQKGTDLWVSMFQNGREQGYSLCVMPPTDSEKPTQTVYFSQSRGSDSLVVYAEHKGWTPNPQAASKYAWEDWKQFSENEATTKGAQYIVDRLGLVEERLKD